MTEHRTVLIAEDEIFTALELQYQLKALGYDVLEIVSSGERAVERALELEPDLLMMDVRLEGTLDGIDAFRMIRRERDVPVVFLTAFGDEDTIRRARESGAFGYILKPFQERELRATIEVALDRHRQQNSLQRSHDDLQQILDGLRIGTTMTDATGHITFVSRVARHLLGIAESEALGRRWTDVFPFSDETIDTLKHKASQPSLVGDKIKARITGGRGRETWMEIEVKADPRNPDRRIFAFYDVTDVHQLRKQLNSDARFFDLIGESEVMQAVYQHIEAVARVDTTVLIEGETGTGKELVARAIHGSSPRKDQPFMAVNCAALTESLAASQLFGHKRGSFTGALSDEPGYFGAAYGGTLFLDEIGDIPLDVQVNLLRVLEEHTVTRVGETKPRKTDVRIIAASHRNLMDEVEAGRFRADLLYRIRVARIDLPPLSSRGGDIPLLADRFLQQFATRIGKDVTGFSNSTMRCLLDYPWPGNVRELRNAIEYAAIRTRGPILQPGALPPEVRSPSTSSEPNFQGAGMSDRDRLLAALRHTGGNRKEAASLLGISRATFYRRLAEYELS